MNLLSKIVDIAKLGLKPGIETVQAAGTHRIVVLDTDKLSWDLYKDSVTGTTIFCMGMASFSRVILPPENAK
jgi:hypothetical protein